MNTIHAGTGCSSNIVFFSRIFESFPPLLRQRSVPNGCKENDQPIGATVHSLCVESIEGLLQRCRRGRGCSELWEKNTFFPKHPVHKSMVNIFILRFADNDRFPHASLYQNLQARRARGRVLEKILIMHCVLFRKYQFCNVVLAYQFQVCTIRVLFHNKEQL